MTPPDDADAELITPREELTPGSLWVPVQGDELRALLDHLALDPESRDRVSSEAATILGKCIPPGDSADPTTGLVLGYVQSGKTMSFTAVAALARDNGFPMVIVITGVAKNLLGQSHGRLVADLQRENNRKWRLFLNPKPDQRSAVTRVLEDWTTETRDRRRQTVLITVLKHSTHLGNLVKLLGQIEMSRIPVLVIDDEADQAGLNTQVGRGRQSPTYQRLVALRQCLPHHTYLQYTATPQAPLLINVIDGLSPKFAELLTPGEDYVGGQVFFEDRPDLVRVIPPNEIPGRQNQLTEVPATLLDALRLFFLGVAAGYLRGEDQQRRTRNRSMLVHPSRETTGHSQFYHWITQIRQQWLDLLGRQTDQREQDQFLEGFRPAYEDLQRSVPELEPFVQLSGELYSAIRTTEVLEVNFQPGGTPQPEWKDAYPWILVGGQAMDRGFTVEGLTITYMPREVGVGNADTVQQRARFFGYKRKYLGFCRVFLEGGVAQAFEDYVAHERDIRNRLQQHRGRPLREWRRAFFLESSLRPTRRQVLDLNYKQDTFSDSWFWPKAPHAGTAQLLHENQETARRFVDSTDWVPDDGDSRRSDDQIHFVAETLPLIRVYRELLVPLAFIDEEDSQEFTGVRLQIADYLADEDNADATCTVYRMRRGQERIRSVNDDDEIPTLFQGPNYADRTAKQDVIYPGDAEIRGRTGVTVQIHTLTVTEKGQGPTVASSVPTVAVWVPASMGRDWLVQRGV